MKYSHMLLHTMERIAAYHSRNMSITYQRRVNSCRLRTASTLPVHLFVATVASRRAGRVCICVYCSEVCGNFANYFFHPLAILTCPFGLLSPLCLDNLTMPGSILQLRIPPVLHRAGCLLKILRCMQIAA